MAITFVGIGTDEDTAGNPCIITLPSMIEGDLVLVYTYSYATQAPTTGGYTEFVATGAIGSRLHGYYKFMGASPDASVTISGTGTTQQGLSTIALVFRGVDTTNPLDVASTTAFYSGTGTAVDPPAITPVNDNCCIVVVGAAAEAQTSIGLITNYTVDPFFGVVADTAFNDTTLATAYRILTGGASSPENPGGFSSWQHSAWRSATTALRPSTAGAGGYPYLDGGVKFVGVDTIDSRRIW